MMSFLILANWKNNSYNSILVIIDGLTKIVYDEPIKVTIDTSDVAELIINMIESLYAILESIVMN